MQNNTVQDSNKKQITSYVKPAITAYDVTTIRQALGPAIGFSTLRVDEDSSLFDE